MEGREREGGQAAGNPGPPPEGAEQGQVYPQDGGQGMQQGQPQQQQGQPQQGMVQGQQPQQQPGGQQGYQQAPPGQGAPGGGQGVPQQGQGVPQQGQGGDYRGGGQAGEPGPGGGGGQYAGQGAGAATTAQDAHAGGQGGPGGADGGGERNPLLAREHADDFSSRWEGIQASFVDDPRRAVHEADQLVEDVMQRLSDTFRDERGRLEGQWDRGEDVGTDDLRITLQRYRSFFHRLLST